MSIRRQDFGDDFIWGVSTSAYQIEGAHNSDGKGFSIWDEFSNNTRKIKNRHNGNVACNFYEHYKSDVQLLKSLNIEFDDVGFNPDIKDKNDGLNLDGEFALKVTFNSDEERQELFIELNERGLKVKAV